MENFTFNAINQLSASVLLSNVQQLNGKRFDLNQRSRKLQHKYAPKLYCYSLRVFESGARVKPKKISSLTQILFQFAILIQYTTGFIWINVILKIEVNFQQIGSIVVVPFGYIVLMLLIAFTIIIIA